jgi:hypothetical protein
MEENKKEQKEKGMYHKELDMPKGEHPLSKACCIQKYFMTWVFGYVKSSRKAAFTQDSHYDLPVPDSIYSTKPLMEKAFTRGKGV